jgi:hypothetical protein
LFEHDLFGKPVPTFPDHALAQRLATRFAIALVAICFSAGPVATLMAGTRRVGVTSVAKANSPYRNSGRW